MREKSQSPLEFLMSPGLVSQADSSSFTIITYHNFKLHVKSFQIQGTLCIVGKCNHLDCKALCTQCMYVSIIDCNNGRRRCGYTVHGHYAAFSTISRDWCHYVCIRCAAAV